MLHIFVYLNFHLALDIQVGAKSGTFCLKRHMTHISLPDFSKSRTSRNVLSRVGGDRFVEKCRHIFLLVTLSGSKHNHSVLDAGKQETSLGGDNVCTVLQKIAIGKTEAFQSTT